MIDKINLIEKFNLIINYWQPNIIAESNEQLVKIAKIQGEFVRHKHENEDELFFVIKGKLQIEFDDKKIELSENEMIIVPKGVYHKPIAHEEVLLMLIEPKSTVNTGDVINDKTIYNLNTL